MASNSLGIHALVWVGGWSPEEAEVAISSSARVGYDLIEIPALDPSRIDVAVVLTQGEIPLEAITAAMAAGRACGARTILNPAPVREYPESLLALVDFLVPNEHEAAHLSGLTTVMPAR